MRDMHGWFIVMEKQTNKKKFSAESSLYVFASLAIVGGFLESFTYFCHDGVFCNAQTGNVVLMAVEIAGGDFTGAFTHLFSILAYIVGILISAVLREFVKSPYRHCAVTLAEILALCAIACIPESAPHIATYASVSLLCAVQYNIFTECHETALATTFCTNNLRQLTLSLYTGIRKNDRAMLKKGGIYAVMLLSFAAGAVFGALSVSAIPANFSVFMCAAVLIPVFVCLIVRCSRARGLTA